MELNRQSLRRYFPYKLDRFSDSLSEDIWCVFYEFWSNKNGHIIRERNYLNVLKKKIFVLYKIVVLHKAVPGLNNFNGDGEIVFNFRIWRTLKALEKQASLLAA